MAEGQARGDPILVGFVHEGGSAKATAALGTLGLEQVTAARATAEHLARGGDFEPLGHGLLRFDTFRASHKSYSLRKRARTIGSGCASRKLEFAPRPAVIYQALPESGDDDLEAGWFPAPGGSDDHPGTLNGFTCAVRSHTGSKPPGRRLPTRPVVVSASRRDLAGRRLADPRFVRVATCVPMKPRLPLPGGILCLPHPGPTLQWHRGARHARRRNHVNII